MLEGRRRRPGRTKRRPKRRKKGMLKKKVEAEAGRKETM
jgi:hypothetical protein